MSLTKKLIYFIIYWIFLSSLINRYLWNNQIVTFLPDVLVICIFLFQTTSRKSLSKTTGKAVLVVLAAFFICGTLSAIINMTPITCFLWGFRMLIRYPLLFYIVYQHFNLKDVLVLKKNLYQSFWINAAFIILQFFQGVRGDGMGGIWSGNGNLAVYILISILVYGSDYFLGRISLLNYALRIAFFFACAMWGEIKMLYFIIPFIIYFEYCFYRKFNFSHFIFIIMAYFLLMPILQWGLSLYYDQSYVNSVLDMDALSEYNNSDYGFSGYSYNRGSCIQMATTQFLGNPFHFLFGHGIGSATVSQLFPSEIGMKYGDLTCYFFFTSSYALIEMGWIGFIFYIVFHLLLFSSFFRLYKRNKNRSVKSWYAIGCLSIVVTFIMIYYNSVPYNDYYAPYLLWALCFIVARDYPRVFSDCYYQKEIMKRLLNI